MLDAVSKQRKALEDETNTAVHVRGNVVTVDGPESELVERLLKQLYGLAQGGSPVEPSDVVRALAVLRSDASAELASVFDDTVLERPIDGKAVVPRSLGQKRYVQYMRRHTLTFGVGPAGTGKTFLAIAMAVRHLLDKEVRRIILSRPAIEAGERLGFLPGTLEEKISPYLRPLYDALHDMLPGDRIGRMMETDVIEIAPLAYMRGRTLNEAFVILDEAQNTTREQMKMFLTRVGTRSRVVVTGDPSQVDLPGGQRSGLHHALRVLEGLNGGRRLLVHRGGRDASSAGAGDRGGVRAGRAQTRSCATCSRRRRRGRGRRGSGERGLAARGSTAAVAPLPRVRTGAISGGRWHRGRFPVRARRALSAISRDTVLEVMERELDRSMGGLHVPGSPRPYFMQYSLRRVHSLRIRAGYGSLLRAREQTAAQVYCECRVGSNKFDNVIDGGLDTRAEERESADWVDAPDDLNLSALQVALWKLSQIKFDEALSDYYDHRKALVSEYLRDEAKAFSKEPALVHREELHHEPFPRKAWEAAMCEVSRRFLSRSDVHDPYISLSAERVHRWLANTDGSRVVTEEVFVELEVSGWILTEDGVYTEATRQLFLRDVDGGVDRVRMEQMADEVLAELDALKDAQTPGSFIGPALLAGQAAATLFHEAMGHRLEGERRVARGETRTFAHKLGKRVLPDGLDVYDDPSAATFDGQPVWGAYQVDDQGVPAQKAVLVEDGILRGFLQSRTPTPESSRSNGHGRHDGLQPPMARMANFVVEPRPGTAQRRSALEEQLVAIAKQQGRRYAVIIERISAGETSTAAYDFQVFKGEPAEVYMLDVETGEKKRIRDVELIGTPLAALQRIVGFGGRSELDQGYCVAESGSLPVSGRAPAILLSEIEMQQSSTTGFHEPLLPPPFADDGSRGRTSDLRKRGRRRKKGKKA